VAGQPFNRSAACLREANFRGTESFWDELPADSYHPSARITHWAARKPTFHVRGKGAVSRILLLSKSDSHRPRSTLHRQYAIELALISSVTFQSAYGALPQRWFWKPIRWAGMPSILLRPLQ
jgi:hypothetical protein